jgi:branched-chain amino acid transport system substrate-binding protein
MASRIHSTLVALAALAIGTTPAIAQKQYGPGATDTEIKIGTTTPYSGPASAYSAGAVSTAAYFAMVNDQGGVNGRRINFISLDDAYSPPKTVEQIRRLIESDEVLFLVNPVGTATNMAVLKYVNQKKVPHLFVGSGATVFNDPEHFPWTMSWTPHYALLPGIRLKTPAHRICVRSNRCGWCASRASASRASATCCSATCSRASDAAST